MEGGERFSHHPVRTRPADSAIKIVVQPSRFGQVQLSPLQEETKEQLFQGLVTRCCKLLCLLCESPASSRNLPQKLNHAAEMLWRLYVGFDPPTRARLLVCIADPRFIHYLLKLTFKLMRLVIRLYAELSEYYEQASSETDANQEQPSESTDGSDKQDPQTEQNVQPSWKHIKRSTCVDDPLHQGVSCDICGSKPLVGVRFKCLVCKDYDLCLCCVKKGIHSSEHEMMASSNPHVFDTWRILTGKPEQPMEWSACETLLNLVWNCLLECFHAKEQLRSQGFLADIMAGFVTLPADFWENGAYQKAHMEIILHCIKFLHAYAESSTGYEYLSNPIFLRVLQNITKTPVISLKISTKALLSCLASHGVSIPLSSVKLSHDEVKDVVSAVLETYKLSSRFLPLFIYTASLVKAFAICPDNLEQFMRHGLLSVLRSLLINCGARVKPILIELFQLIKQQDGKPQSSSLTEFMHPTPEQQSTVHQVQDASLMDAAIYESKNFQMEDEGMHELIDILLGHVTKTVPEKPKTAHDVDSAMAHSIATALTLVYVLLLQSDMEQRSQLVEYIAKVPNLFNSISSLLKVIIFYEEISLETVVILEMRMLLCLSEWTKYSLHACVEVGKAGIIHLLNAIVGGIRQSFQLSEGNAYCLVMMLQTFLHCMQDPNYLWPFHRTAAVDNLLAFLKYPQIGFQVFSKLVLSFLYNMMDDNEFCMLELSPQEVQYMFPDFFDIERNPPNYVALLLTSLTNLTEVKDLLDPGQLIDPKNVKQSIAKQRCQDTSTGAGQSLVNLVRTNATNLSKSSAVIWCLENFLSSEKEPLQEGSSRLIWNLIHNESFSLELLTSYHCILLMLQAMERWSPITHALLWKLGQRMHEVENSLKAYCFYIQCCYQSGKYTECIEWCNCILSTTSQEQITNTAMLLKGKSLYHIYQREQLLLVKRIGVMTAKQANLLQDRCYNKTEQVVKLLGKARDFHYIDTEGSKLLDFAMMDYLREVNKLGDCNRCMLCRNQAELRLSHIVPVSVLNELSADKIVEPDKKVMLSTHFSLKKPLVRKSPGQVAHKMLCGACENRLSLNAETKFCSKFFKPVLHRSSNSIQYDKWLYHFCVSMLFRGLSYHSITCCPNNSELYNVFLLCRNHLLSLPYRIQEKDPKSELKQSHKEDEKHLCLKETAMKEQTSAQGLQTCVPPSKKSIRRAQATATQYAYELFNNNTTGDLDINLLLLPHDVSSCPKDTFETLKGALGAPMVTNIEDVHLSDGSLDYYGQAHFFMISFGSVCILTRFAPSRSYKLPTETHILPIEGTYSIPKEEDLWERFPYGAWHTLLQASTHAEKSHQLIKMRASKDSSKQPAYIGESDPLVDRGWVTETYKRQGFLKKEIQLPMESPSLTSITSPDFESSPIQTQVGSLLQSSRLAMNHTFLPEEFTISQYVPEQGAGHKCLVFPDGHYLLLHVTQKSAQKVVSLFLCFSMNPGYGSENPYVLIIIHHFKRYHLADGVFVSLSSKGIKAERFLVEKGGSGKYRLALSKVQDLVGEMFPELMRAKGYYSVHSLMERAIATRTSQHTQAQIPMALDMKCCMDNCWYCADLCHCCMKPASFGYTLLCNESYKLLKFCSSSCQAIQEDYHPHLTETEVLKQEQTHSPSLPIQVTKVIQTGAHGNTILNIQLHIESHTKRLYVLCQFRAPWQQIALDFFISDQYEPEIPVGYVLRYSTIRNIISKSKALLRLILKYSLHPEIQRMGYSDLANLKLSMPSSSTSVSPTHFHIPKILSMLPPEFIFTKPYGSTPGHKCLSLPEGHHILLHYTQKTSGSLWKTYFLCCREEDTTPYIIFLDGQTVKGAFISHGDQQNTGSLMDLVVWSPDELGAIQKEADEFLPVTLKSRGFSSIYAFFQRQKCTGRLLTSETELSLDHRCCMEGCWYCQDLCHCCMAPIPALKPGIVRGVFCSSKCCDMFEKDPNSSPTKVAQVQFDNIPYLSQSLLHITTVVSTPLSEHTVAVIDLCVGNGSMGVSALCAYILCQLRTLDEQVFLDYLVSDDFALTEPLWYAKGDTITPKVKQIVESNLIKVILQPAIEQFLKATNPATVCTASEQIQDLLTPFPAPLSVSASATDSPLEDHDQTEYLNQTDISNCHEILLHTTLDHTDTTYFLCNIGQNTEKLYLLLVSSCVSKPQPIVGIVITPCDEMNVNGVMVAVVPALPGSMLPLITMQMQQIVNCILPMLLRKKGYLSIHSFLHRLKYTRSIPRAMLPSLDDKCSPKGCWYCCNLCHYCLQPVAMECYPDRKEKAHLSNTLLFCSELCCNLLLEPPSKFQSLFFFDLRNQQTEIGHFMPSAILHVLKAKLSLAYGNTVVSIILNTGDGSEGLPLGQPYVLYGERSVNRASFYELFVSNDCIPQECLPYLHSCIEVAGSLVNCTRNISHILPTAIELMGFPDLTSLVSHYCSSQPSINLS